MDPRRLLESAAEARCTVEVLPRGGSWRRGEIVRVERGGVVLRLPGGLNAGVDLRCWLTIDGQPYTFEASVLRAGVPVPDRSQDGVLIGFLDGWSKADPRPNTVVLEVLPHNGGPVSLTSGAARIVDLTPSEWTVATPLDFPLVFVEQGAVRLRLGLPDRAPMDLSARVGALRQGEQHLLYSLRIEAVEDADRYRDMIAAMRSALGL
jgi:hypothetical protein